MLITHSMEEAEVLSDRIGIMAEGVLQVLGSTLELKNKYGTGYRLTVTVQPNEEDKLLQKAQFLSKAELVSSFAGTITFQLGVNFNLSEIFGQMEQLKTTNQIIDWGMTQTNLEDVFISIVTRASSRKRKIFIPWYKMAYYFLMNQIKGHHREKE